MRSHWQRRFYKFPSPLPILFIIIVTTLVILYGRGYRIDTKDKNLIPTGLLSATSDPIGAQVYINSILKTATNNAVNIEPGWYTVKIVKEGFIPWEKKFRIQGEIASKTDAFLFPTSPSLSPLTVTGIEHPVMSPDGTKLAYAIPLEYNNNFTTKKAGLWVYEFAERPLGINRDPRQVGISDSLFNFSKTKVVWSPDSTQLLVTDSNRIRLYNANRLGDYQDVSATLPTIIADWERERLSKEYQKLASFKEPVINVITNSTKIVSFSPDESKILYQATASATLPQIISPPLIGTNPTEEKRTLEPGKLYVYDSREDKNFFVLDINELPVSSPSPSPSSSPIPKDRKANKASPSFNLQPFDFAQGVLTTYNLQQNYIYWFPTSRHLLLAYDGKIDIMEYDRTNWVTVYQGPFVDGFLAPWPNGSRIIIMTNLNAQVSNFPNLYTVNLR